MPIDALKTTLQVVTNKLFVSQKKIVINFFEIFAPILSLPCAFDRKEQKECLCWHINLKLEDLLCCGMDRKRQ